MRTAISSIEFKRKGVGYFTKRCVLQGAEFTITNNGRPVAALVPVDLLSRLERAAADLAEQAAPPRARVTHAREKPRSRG